VTRNTRGRGALFAIRNVCKLTRRSPNAVACHRLNHKSTGLHPEEDGELYLRLEIRERVQNNEEEWRREGRRRSSLIITRTT